MCIRDSFSVADYEKAAAAYLAGLEQYLTSHSVWRTAPTAVASFSLAPLDTAIDARLEALGRPDLRGKAAVALARRLTARYRQLFSGPAWDKLAARRGQPLRPKWTRTTPRDFAHPALYYIQQLIGEGTIMTFIPATLTAFRRDGIATPTLDKGLDEGETHLATLAALGIDFEAVAAQLQAEHLAASDHRFQTLVQAVVHKRDALDVGQDVYKRQTAYRPAVRRRTETKLRSSDTPTWRSMSSRMKWKARPKTSRKARPINSATHNRRRRCASRMVSRAITKIGMVTRPTPRRSPGGSGLPATDESVSIHRGCGRSERPS